MKVIKILFHVLQWEKFKEENVRVGVRFEIFGDVRLTSMFIFQKNACMRKMVKMFIVRHEKIYAEDIRTQT